VSDYYTLLSSKNSEVPRTKSHLHESPALITFLYCFGFSNIRGLISLPTNSWLNEYPPLFTKVATEEHHFGTSEYMLMLAVIGGLVGIELLIQIYISNKTSFLKKMMQSLVLPKCYTINTMLMKFMILFVKSINGLSFFRDNETTYHLFSFD
jgi:NADH-quinone oxidoreductase subunit L